MSKGSKRRPLRVSRDEFDSNWDACFNKATGDVIDLGEIEFTAEDDDIASISDEEMEAMIQKRFSTEH